MPPRTSAIGDDLNEPIAFDGYFLKIIGTTRRRATAYFAPMLIGRLRQDGPGPNLDRSLSARRPEVDGGRPLDDPGPGDADARQPRPLVLRPAAPTSPPPGGPSATVATPNDQIDPESLADWMKGDAPEAKAG